MKKIIALALLMFAGLIGSASAQYRDYRQDRQRDNRRYEQRDDRRYERVYWEQRYVRIGNRIYREVYKVKYRYGYAQRTLVRREFIGYRDRYRDNDFQFNIFLRF